MQLCKACTSRPGRVHVGVLKSSSTGKDRTANAAEHLLVIDIEAKSTSPIEMPHVGVGGRDEYLSSLDCPAFE